VFIGSAVSADTISVKIGIMVLVGVNARVDPDVIAAVPVDAGIIAAIGSAVSVSTGGALGAQETIRIAAKIIRNIFVFISLMNSSKETPN
jgi:hypothetical protein